MEAASIVCFCIHGENAKETVGERRRVHRKVRECRDKEKVRKFRDKKKVREFRDQKKKVREDRD